MADSSSVDTDVELELYEEIVGNLDYTTPVTERSSRPISYSEDRTTATTFKQPIITNTSESTVISASAAIVDSVTWPDPRSQCSLAGKKSSATAACAALGRNFIFRDRHYVPTFIGIYRIL